MFDLPLYATGLSLVLVLGALLWLASIPLRDASIVDTFWSLFFLVLATLYVLAAPLPSDRALLMLFLVSVWAMRLALYIAARNRGKPEDSRYRAIRAEHEPGFWFKSFYLVFGLQAILAWVISLPLLAAALGQTPLGWLDALAVALWTVGFAFEALGDHQLAAFKADPSNAGKVLDRGLWRYTRHPNYFGEACIWWGYYLLAVAAGGWWSLIAPALMTYLLLRVSGVALLERDIGARRPAYRDYIRRTNAFFPGPPRD